MILDPRAFETGTLCRFQNASLGNYKPAPRGCRFKMPGGLNIREVRNAAAIVISTSLIARPKKRAACTPWPGIPRIYLYGQDILIEYAVFVSYSKD